MCPLWPLHIFLLYVLCLVPLFVVAQNIPALNNGYPKNLDVYFAPEMEEKMTVGQTKTLEFRIANLDDFKGVSEFEVELTTSDPDIATADQTKTLYTVAPNFVPNSNWTGTFNLTGQFIGYTDVAVKLWGSISNQTAKPLELLGQSLSNRVTVIRTQRPVDKAFIYTVAILVSIAFINMGCTLDLGVVKETLKKPIGPAIGFCCQYIFMPLCAFGLASLLLSNSGALQLGLFVTGCSPGGGASNMWTFVLGGNLHLSITMTCISTIASFAFMPLWTMTLGRLIFTDKNIIVPYAKIASLAAGLALPLMIGLAIRQFFPKVASVLSKMLKPLSGIFLLIIIGFGIYANLYMIRLMNWRVLLSGLTLVWLGYAFGWIISTIFRLPWTDTLAVAVETGVQNTGIAIFVLRFTLDQPDADINTVIPVAVAIMTPIPLITLWILQKFVLHRYGYCIPIEQEETKETISDEELAYKMNGDSIKTVLEVSSD